MTTIQNKRLTRIGAALALATVLGGMSIATAQADDGGRSHDDRGRTERHWDQHRHYDGDHRGYVYERPRAYHYGPPPVYYVPQPPPPVGLEFVFPLHIR